MAFLQANAVSSLIAFDHNPVNQQDVAPVLLIAGDCRDLRNHYRRNSEWEDAFHDFLSASGSCEDGCVRSISREADEFDFVEVYVRLFSNFLRSHEELIR